VPEEVEDNITIMLICYMLQSAPVCVLSNA